MNLWHKIENINLWHKIENINLFRFIIKFPLKFFLFFPLPFPFFFLFFPLPFLFFFLFFSLSFLFFYFLTQQVTFVSSVLGQLFMMMIIWIITVVYGSLDICLSKDVNEIKKYDYSQSCLMWPFKGRLKYGHIRQVVAKYR